MSIENTQWANYDNRQTFDRLLATLSPWGFVDSSYGNDCFPSISFLGDGTNYFHIRVWVAHQDSLNRVDYGNSTDENTPQFVVESNWEECDAVIGFRDHYTDTFYEGEEIDRVISVCTKIAPIFEIYAELVGRGYEVISTGGGCDIWAKDFGDHTVYAGDSLTGHLLYLNHDVEEDNPQVVTFNAIGLSVMDQDHCAVDFDHGENFILAKTNNMAAVKMALDTVEGIASQGALNTKDLLAEMSKVYNDILIKHFKGMKPMSADEFLAEYRDVMSIDQIKLITSFIGFWDDLQSMEVQS